MCFFKSAFKVLSLLIVVYEVMRQQDYPDLLRYEPFKGEDYLIEE